MKTYNFQFISIRYWKVKTPLQIHKRKHSLFYAYSLNTYAEWRAMSFAYDGPAALIYGGAIFLSVFSKSHFEVSHN